MLNFLVSIYIATVAYAIVRHKLMDIEVIIKKTLVLAGLFAMVMAVIAIVTTISQSYLEQIVHLNRFILTSISVGIALALYEPVRLFLVKSTDRFLFQKKENIKIILNRLSQDIIAILDIDTVAKKILTTFKDSLRAESAAIIIKDDNEKAYSVLDAYNVKTSDIKYGRDNFFIKYLLQFPDMINIEDDVTKKTLPVDILTILDELNAVICIPLFIHTDLIGILTLGKKKSDEEYTPDELDYFPTIESQVAIALSNARILEVLKKSQADFAQQAKMAAIGTLSAGIGHEIKNPLNNIAGLIGMLRVNKKHNLLKEKTKDELEGEVFEVLERIDGNVKRATAVIERLSGFAKKPKEFKVEPVQLEQAVEYAVVFLSPQFESNNIKIYKNFGRALPKVMADLRALEDVFLNLLTNAYHAVKDNGSITISTFESGSEVEVRIKDTGRGIAPENLEKIFDPFFTTKDTSRNDDPEAIKGTGLGLYIVRQIIKQFGGRISVDSELGKGTTFHIYLPMTKSAAKGI